MIDHMGVDVSNFDAAKKFYSAALAPLGLSLLSEVPAELTGRAAVAGFGTAPEAEFWICDAAVTQPPLHVAFRASNRAMVDGFYRAALQAGGRDNGAPGIRAVYHPNYYAAFVLDPDGHNIEAVCHAPE